MAVHLFSVPHRRPARQSRQNELQRTQYNAILYPQQDSADEVHTERPLRKHQKGPRDNSSSGTSLNHRSSSWPAAWNACLNPIGSAPPACYSGNSSPSAKCLLTPCQRGIPPPVRY